MVAAVVAACGSALGQAGSGWLAGAALILLALRPRRRFGLALLFAAAVLSGAAVQARSSLELPSEAAGPVQFTADVVSDPAPGRSGFAFVVEPLSGRLAGARVAVATSDPGGVSVGARVAIEGRLSVRQGRLHRSPIAGWVMARRLDVTAPPSGPLAAADFLRARVRRHFDGSEPAALMRGFLIGDTSAVSPTTMEDMRRSGLLHFVAVSGGNVAIFLGAVWLALGILPMGPRVRAGVGLAAVGLFVLVTRWEPSVVRAGLMVGMLLCGRLAGIPVDGWTALGSTVTILMLVAPQLIGDLGFQLSALATAGLLVGSNLWSNRRPAVLWRGLAATLAAQLAVTPLLLSTFGGVPLFAAVANVVAAPLVTLGTAVGWAVVLTGASFLEATAEVAASWVIAIAAWASALPQVGLLGVAALVAWVALLRWRAWLGVALAVTALALSAIPPPPVLVPTAVFLDIGQGDAALLLSPDGSVIAIDTGPDPVAYAAALRRHGIDHIDLLVLTHADSDHTGGLEAVAGRVTVGTVWIPDFTSGAEWDLLLGDLGPRAVAVQAGASRRVAEFRLTAVGPLRRYAAANDGSVALWVDVAGWQLLVAGDVEAVAQAELTPLRPDVMLVPHHGSRTTDLTWLERTVGGIAVLSYGENSFGHPSPEVLATLDESGAVTLHTSGGDVAVRLGAGAAGGNRKPP